MKLRTLIAGTAVVLFCGGLGVCVAQEAPAPAAAPKVAPAAKHHPKHNHRHHHGKSHGTQEFTEQQLQAMQAQPPSK